LFGRIDSGISTVFNLVYASAKPQVLAGESQCSRLQIADWRLLILARTSALKVHHLTNHRKKLQFSFSPLSFTSSIISWWQLTYLYPHPHNPKDGHSYQ